MKTALYLAIYKREDSGNCYCCGNRSLNFHAERLPKGNDTLVDYFKEDEITEKDIPEEADEWTLKELDALFEIEETLLISQYEEKPIRRYL